MKSKCTCESEDQTTYMPPTSGDILFRFMAVIAIAVMFGFLVSQPGCTYNRNAPLIEHNAPFINADLNIKDSANGNTITPKP